VVLTVLGAVSRFLLTAGDDSLQKTGAVELWAVLISLGLAVGLLLLNNICRIIFVILAALGIFGSFMSTMSMIDTQHNFGKVKTTLQDNVQRLEAKNRLTTQEENQLKLQKKQLERAETVSGATFAQYYAIYVGTMVYSGFVVVYLLMPSVKQKFEQ
jgi:hypothetical protein